MNNLIALIIASLVRTSIQGFTGAPLQWMNRVVMPKSLAVELLDSSAPKQLLIKDRPQKISRNNVPYFAFKSDSTIVWEGTDRCIEAAGGKSGDAVHLTRCTGEPAQTWNWIPDNHGGNLIQLKDTSKCLDASVEGGFNGIPIVLWNCESKGAGGWKFEEPAPVSARGRFMVIDLIKLVGMAILSLGAFLWLYRRSCKLTMAQRGATSTLDADGISLNSPLAVQITASPSGDSIQRSGNVTMSAAGDLLEEYMTKQQELFEEYKKKRQAELAEREASHQPEPAQAWTSTGTVQGDQPVGEEEAKKRWLERQEFPAWGGGWTASAKAKQDGGESILGVNFDDVRADLVRLMHAPDWDDGSLAPLLIRLAWHSSGTYSKFDGTGGSNGATMRHALEASDPENAGLTQARSFLDPIQARYPGLSFADLWILAAYVAIETTGGPKMKFTGGRKDAGAEKAIAPGRLPGAETGLKEGFNVDSEGRLEGWENLATHIRGVFGRMGFSDREMVALIAGGHVYGRCHPEHSGYAGAWVENPTIFSNEYAADMIEDKWTAVTHDTKLSDGGAVPEEVRPRPGKRQYIDLTKYEPDEDRKAEIEAPNVLAYPPGQYRCVSQWVNCREKADTTSPIIGRQVQDTVLSLVTVKIFGTAVRGLAERGGWVSIVGTSGMPLFERVGDLDVQSLTGKYRVLESSGAPIFGNPGQLGETGRKQCGEVFTCSQMKYIDRGQQVGSIYGQLETESGWVLVFAPNRGLLAELIVEGYNEKPRKQVKGQSGHQMMLVSDMALLWDADFRKALEVYAEDHEALKNDFGEAFTRLTELGCPWSKDKNEVLEVVLP